MKNNQNNQSNQKVTKYEAQKGKVKKVVLLYSGGLDTSVMLKWIQDEYQAEVITFTADLGQSQVDLEAIKKKALKTGAIKAYVEDLKDEFSDNFVSKAIKANALYGDKYPLSSSIARYLIAQKAIEIAKKEGADVFAHGCTGKGNDQIRFDVTAFSLDPNIKVIAPVREWNMTREEEIDYAKKHGIEVKATKEKSYSVDENMWGRSSESGILECPDIEPPANVFEWVTIPEQAPDKPTYVEIEFEKGLPTTLNGKKMKLAVLIQELNKIAGQNGIGIIDHIENRVVGMKSREVYECPAATVIIEAHRDLQKMVCSNNQDFFRTIVEDKWTNLAFSGLWLEPLMDDLNSFLDSVNKYVTGWVRLKLYKGSVRVVGRKSPFSLYDHDLVSFDNKVVYNQASAAPFIELFGLMSKTAHQVHSKES
ncbi:MAG: argininosuccinate synthase [Patescibacteria group bacterium]